jgi:hypothetical protein
MTNHLGATFTHHGNAGAKQTATVHPEDIHTDRAFYYVSCVDFQRRTLLAGPYATHPEALAKVDKVRAMGGKADPRAAFYAFGTAGSDESVKTVFGVV